MAYDSVLRTKIWKTMQKMGISEELKNEGPSLRVKIGNRTAHGFKTSKGLLQGCAFVNSI